MPRVDPLLAIPSALHYLRSYFTLLYLTLPHIALYRLESRVNCLLSPLPYERAPFHRKATRQRADRQFHPNNTSREATDTNGIRWARALIRWTC
jgi:hypothetical protein